MKNKIFKVSFVLLCFGLFATSVSATTYNKDLSKSFEINQSSAFYMDYDIGSGFPYDDVYSQSFVSVSNDASGEATAKTMCENGKSAYSRGTSKSNGYIRSGLAEVPGQDYANKLIYTGKRTVNGTTVSWNNTVY